MKKIENIGMYPIFLFKECDQRFLRSTERCLIEKYNPPYNIIGKRRCV